MTRGFLELTEKIKLIVAASFDLPYDEVTLDTGPANTASWDSFGQLNLVLNIEKEFKIILEFDEIFKQFDALITPTSPTVPFKVGEKMADPLQMYLSDVCTLPINIAGVPAISIPAGFVEGLPIGMQIIGRPFGEETILQIAYAYEQATEWHKRRPSI